MDMVRTFVETPGFRKKVAPLVKGAECGFELAHPYLIDQPLYQSDGR